ncbi:MAG TPA: gliding motility lipoprotein GldD [Flavobacteriales bacterium]|jgi:gliding motility-associated lipoprotein GldD|nr:gliding motility lipoprotein GldD [Flavobacteriales bacterium]HIK63358.1 gliding motility lipoprotein GldD [Flavobacteriales bacterium]
MKTKFLFFITVLLMACNTDYTPKPKAFIKLDFPEKVYEKLNVDCPFIFEFPVYSKLLKKENSCSMDLTFPMQNGVLYISYFTLDDNLMSHTDQSRKLAYKHNGIANGITEQLYINDSFNVYGVLYDYEGITATAAQFYLTDSVNHFFRGALYFNTEVSDSILPINLFLKYDIKHLIETFHWKNK